MLHLLSLPVIPPEILERIAPGDDVLLQQGLVWCARLGHHDNSWLLQLLDRNSQVYVLREMLSVQGICTSNILAGVQIIDYAGFVDLAVKNPVIHTWC
ncbi:DsrH/TusB family sulfur metabolism protein [Methylomonas sp. AM2-LC]|uniref:DsrH/TusB family sulfur metabolism protein n=1 Tax=Methylomonas sp. AM2-LC TaxID=3153301 RepID=UPI003265A7A2